MMSNLQGLLVWINCAIVLFFLCFIVNLTHADSASGDNAKNLFDEFERKPETKEQAVDCPAGFDESPLFVIALDGFFIKYLDRGITPYLNALASKGVRAKYLISQFPSVTAPNMYSTMTGLYPESHGLIDNSFVDFDLDKVFCPEDKCWCTGHPTPTTRHDPIWWKNGEPIWITAAKNKLVTAMHGWKYGAEAPIQGILPNLTNVFNNSLTLSDIVKKSMEWIDLPAKERPRLIGLYSTEPDSSGHNYGPNSKKIDEVIKELDKGIALLMLELFKRDLLKCANIIIFSDHGMSEVSKKKLVYLQKYGKNNGEAWHDLKHPRYLGPFCSWRPKDGVDPRKIRDSFLDNHCHMKVYLKEELPKRLHYANNRRIPDLIAIADQRWMISLNKTKTPWCPCGNHGFDPDESDMRGMFIGYGPAFKEGYMSEPFKNTEIYNLMTSILNLDAAPNNGTLGGLNHLLRKWARPHIPKPLQDEEQAMRRDICRKVVRHPSYKTCRNCVCGSKCEAGAVEKYELMLDLNDDDTYYLEDMIFPWGTPAGGAGLQGCVLTQPDFISGYSTHLHVPLWVGYKVDGPILEPMHRVTNKTNTSSNGDDDIEWDDEDDDDYDEIKKRCIMVDPRLYDSQSAHCYDFNNPETDWGPIVFDGDTTSGLPALLSSIAPMYRHFKKGPWHYLRSLTRTWSRKFSPLYVTTGTIYDENMDGIRDLDLEKKHWLHNVTGTVPIPTHYYKIIVRCLPTKDKNEMGINGESVLNCDGKLDVLSFILPHLRLKPVIKTRSLDQYLFENVATIRDIELLTGVTMFPLLERELQAQLKIKLPQKLWSTS